MSEVVSTLAFADEDNTAQRAEVQRKGLGWLRSRGAECPVESACQRLVPLGLRACPLSTEPAGCDQSWRLFPRDGGTRARTGGSACLGPRPLPLGSCAVCWGALCRSDFKDSERELLWQKVGVLPLHPGKEGVAGECAKPTIILHGSLESDCWLTDLLGRHSPAPKECRLDRHKAGTTWLANPHLCGAGMWQNRTHTAFGAGRTHIPPQQPHFLGVCFLIHSFPSCQIGCDRIS